MVLLFIYFGFHGRVPVSPLIPYNTEFVQRGFTHRAAFEERGFTVLKFMFGFKLRRTAWPSRKEFQGIYRTGGVA